VKVYVLNPPYIPHFGRAMRWQDTGRAGTLYYPILLARPLEFWNKLDSKPGWEVTEIYKENEPA
jgi:hypothetical protein